MTFLYKFNKNGTTAEGYVQADSEADAQAKVDAKFPEGSKTKVLGIEQVYVATTRNSRMSAFKGRPLAAACQGLKASDALKVVEFSPKKAAEIIKKTILSAIANAENNHGAKGAADLCRDGGQSAVAGAVELGGAAAALYVSLPLLTALLGFLEKLL